MEGRHQQPTRRQARVGAAFDDALGRLAGHLADILSDADSTRTDADGVGNEPRTLQRMRADHLSSARPQKPQHCHIVGVAVRPEARSTSGLTIPRAQYVSVSVRHQ